MSAYTLTRIIGSAFLMGFVAAAPIGPVNMMAIRRGLLGGPRHTLICGIGAVTGDLLLFSLTLWGGHYFIADFQNGRLASVLAIVGLVVLLPFGAHFLLLALKGPHSAYCHTQKHCIDESLPTQFAEEVTRAFLLTILNPLTVVYWIGATSSWIPTAYSLLGSSGVGWGIVAAGTGMLVWFGGLVLMVRFIPHRVSAVFFRLVNAALGIALIGLAVFCAMLLVHPPSQ